MKSSLGKSALRDIEKLVEEGNLTKQQISALRSIYRKVHDCLIDIEEANELAQNIGVRNPSFRGDMIGYANDEL